MQNKQFTEESFHFGRDGEQKWMSYSLLKKRMLIEVGALREKLGDHAPSIYLPEKRQGSDRYVSPDFLSINAKAMLNETKPTWMDKGFVWTLENMWKYPFLWNEVKSKNGCTWSKKLRCWQTGIDGRHLRHYIQVQNETVIPVMLFFLQLSDTTAQADAPPYAGPCPVGIYACPVSKAPDMTWHPRYGLGCSIEHAYEREGMVYWNTKDLLPIGSLEDLSPRQPKAHISPVVSRKLPEQGYSHKKQSRDDNLRKVVENICRIRAMQGRGEDDD
jgi:hypothetical protein